jgi:hypothetical protein
MLSHTVRYFRGNSSMAKLIEGMKCQNNISREYLQRHLLPKRRNNSLCSPCLSLFLARWYGSEWFHHIISIPDGLHFRNSPLFYGFLVLFLVPHASHKENCVVMALCLHVSREGTFTQFWQPTLHVYTKLHSLAQVLHAGCDSIGNTCRRENC